LNIEHRRTQLKRDAEELGDAIAKAAKNKDWPSWLDQRLSDHQTAKKEFERQEAVQRATPVWARGAADASGSSVETKAIQPASPLNIPEAEYRGLYHAAIKRLPSYRVDCDHAGASQSAWIFGDDPR
jgi:hypothetical protein